MYELRMLQGYYNQDHNPNATFDLFFRELPPDRRYMITAGLELAVYYIETLSFRERAIGYLAE